jgi:hypothetical protein
MAASTQTLEEAPMKRTPLTQSHTSIGPAPTLTIRTAGPADQSALARLAQLDSATPPEPVGMLLAELDGELHAAVPLGGGSAIADPFHPTVELVAILSARARQLEEGGSRPAKRRWRPIALRVRALRAGVQRLSAVFGG